MEIKRSVYLRVININKHFLLDFIKKGETKGKVTIDILNEGINAFKPEEYGDLITIVRSFTTTGVNSYSLRSASGGVISKKKTEVR